ncbi:MAG: nucleotidyltransferase family protein [Patescibacteria group bacterium]
MALEDIKKILKELLPGLREKYHVSELGIFGSYATGEQKEGSDVDVLVEFREPISLFKYVELKLFLEEKLKMEVDLVQKSGLKRLIKDDILKETLYI